VNTTVEFAALLLMLDNEHYKYNWCNCSKNLFNITIRTELMKGMKRIVSTILKYNLMKGE
jgi:hypothetical protein